MARGIFDRDGHGSGVDSGRILRFSFGCGVKTYWKIWTGDTFKFQQ